MKKIISAIIATFVMGIALPSFAADSAPVLNMNVRFQQIKDNSGIRNYPVESRISLHAVEITASQEVDNIGGVLQYRFADQTFPSTVKGNDESNPKNYPVEAKAYIKSGNFKLTGGLQFVPFGIYKWNNVYNPFLDIPGSKGMIWDSDWGVLGTYNAKPVLIDLGYWQGAGELFKSATGAYTREKAEKDTFTGRIGYDILSNLNAGFSYMTGKVDMLPATINAEALTKKEMWAVDTTWGIVPNLQLEAEYVDYGFKAGTQLATKVDGNIGLVQLKYDILKVPGALNKISPVLQYSWDDIKDGIKTKNYQEELWFKAGKNLDVFLQFVQTKVPNVDDAKCTVLAVKYAFQ